VLSTASISILLSLALLAAARLDFFWSMVAFVPAVIAVLFIVLFVAYKVAPPKLELVAKRSERPNLRLFH
jgi:hypothetical protein